MTEQAPSVEPSDEDLPPYFHDTDDDPVTRPDEHLEPDEDDDR